MLKIKNANPRGNRSGAWIAASLFFLVSLVIPVVTRAEEVNREGWPIPDLKGLLPYSIQIKQVDGVQKMVEKFFSSVGGNVARISGNGKVFAYAVDSDREPPIDYLLLDPDGLGKFTQKLRPEEFYKIPEWVSD